MNKTTSLLLSLIVAVVFVSSQAFAGGAQETFGYYRSDVPEMKRAVSGETVQVRIIEAPDKPVIFRNDVTEVQGAMPTRTIDVSREYTPYISPVIPAVTCTVELEALDLGIMERPDVPEIALGSVYYEENILSACLGTGVRESEGDQRMDIPEMWYYGSPVGG